MQPMRLSGEKSFKFNRCDFASLHSDDLRRHLKTNSGKKTFICSQCDFASVHLDDLRKHLKTQTGNKSFKCYASVLAGNLRRHLKTDSGKKSFICNQCDFTSLHLDDLRKHLKTHTGKVIEMQPKRLCICFGTQFEKTFENLLWKKVVKMQSM